MPHLQFGATCRCRRFLSIFFLTLEVDFFVKVHHKLRKNRYGPIGGENCFGCFVSWIETMLFCGVVSKHIGSYLYWPGRNPYWKRARRESPKEPDISSVGSTGETNNTIWGWHLPAFPGAPPAMVMGLYSTPRSTPPPPVGIWMCMCIYIVYRYPILSHSWHIEVEDFVSVSELTMLRCWQRSCWDSLQNHRAQHFLMSIKLAVWMSGWGFAQATKVWGPAVPPHCGFCAKEYGNGVYPSSNIPSSIGRFLRWLNDFEVCVVTPCWW